LNAILPTLIAWLREYGYPALWLSIFVAAFGLPLPGFLLLLASGAISALGDFNLFLLIPIAFSAAVSGDALGYLVGRRLGNWLLTWADQKKHPLSGLLPKIKEARDYFSQRGSWAIFLSRFLFLPLGGPINMLAGASDYGYRRFVLYDFSGQLLGALIPLSLGYFFGDSWKMLGTVFDVLSFIVLGLLVATILIIRLMKRSRQRPPDTAIPLLPQVAVGNVALDNTSDIGQESEKNLFS